MKKYIFLEREIQDFCKFVYNLKYNNVGAKT
jgi:hypothetical protein